MFSLIAFFVSIVSAQSSCPFCDSFQMPSFQMPQSFGWCQQSPCTTCTPPPPPPPCQSCQLPPPPVTEGSSDKFRSHFDSANRQGCQDTMRANANACGSNSLADDRCAAQNAKLNLGADVKSCNNRFHEVNENEVLCHKKNAREECGDNSARKAAIDFNAGNNCRAAQSHKDATNSNMCAGRDACSRAEDCCQTNVDGCRSANSIYQRPCSFF